MHSERAFAGVRKAAPPKADVARVLAAGLWADISHRHLRAGGQDVRKMLRKYLQAKNTHTEKCEAPVQEA